MATLTKTFSFAADSEGLNTELDGSGQSPGFSWINTDGNPAGCVRCFQGTKNVTYTDHWRHGSGTWESIFGIPANSAITQVRVTAWQTKVAQNAKLNGTNNVRLRIVDPASGTTGSVTDAPLASAALGTSLTGWVSQPAGSLVNVLSGKQASTSAVGLCIEWNVATLGGGGTASVEVMVDAISIELTYSAVAASLSRTAADTLTVSDSAARSAMPYAATATDTVAASDSATRTSVRNRSASDSATASDSAAGSVSGAAAANYRDEVMADSPALYWRLGETSGTVAEDETANNRDGTYQGTYTLGQPGLIVDVNPAVKVTEGGVTGTHTPFALSSSRTFEGFTSYLAPNSWAGLIRSSGGNSGPTMQCADDGSVSWVPAGTNTGGGVSWPAGTIPTDDSPFHWALTYDDATGVAELFINGVSQGAKTVTSKYPAGVGTMTFGYGGHTENAAWYWNGRLDEFAIYDSILSSTRIQAHYNRSGHAGLQVWYRGDGITGLADGAAVSSWPDESGSGRNATQATAAAQPVYRTGVVNGKPAVRFDGTDDAMQATIGADDSRTLFVVVKQSVVLNDKFAFGIGPYGAAGLATYNSGTDWSWQETQASPFVANIGGAPDTWSVITIKVNSAASLDAYIDGGTPTNLDPNDQVTTETTLNLGQQGNSQRYFNGDFAEVLVYDTALSDADRQQIENYLTTKYGLGAVSLARTAADTLTASDSASRTSARNRSATDTAGASDAVTRTGTRDRTASDLTSVAEVASRSSISLSREPTDSVTASDAAARTSARSRTAADTVTASDSAVGSLTVNLSRTAADTVAASDSAAGATGGTDRTASDSVAASDAASRGSISLSRSAAETVSAADAAARTSSRERTASDSTLASDSAALTSTGTGRTAADTVTRSDFVAAVVALGAAASDTITVTADQAVAASVLTGATSDSVSVLDAATAALMFSRAAADTLTLSDSAAGILNYIEPEFRGPTRALVLSGGGRASAVDYIGRGSVIEQPGLASQPTYKGRST